MTLRLTSLSASLAIVLLASACGGDSSSTQTIPGEDGDGDGDSTRSDEPANSDPDDGSTGTSSGGGGGSETSSGGGGGADTSSGGGNDGSTGGNSSVGSGGESSGGGAGPDREQCVMTPEGVVCTCQKLASFGALGVFGAVPGADGTEALGKWLNEKSTVSSTYYPVKPELTREFLSGYDLILLQNLQGWSFSPDEVAEFEAWVRGGGGVIALAGYSDNGNEVLPTNELLAFSDVQYAGISGAGDTVPVTNDSCAYCFGNAAVQAGFSGHPIGENVNAVGAFWGRSIDAGTAGSVVASDGDKVYGATASVGAGRVFAFHDEWVTYVSQWGGDYLQNDCRTFEASHACFGRHPTADFQIPQFWFNTLLWASGDAQCVNIDDPAVIR